MSPTRATMSSAVRRPVSARRTARLSPTPAIETAIWAPSATMRSTAVEPVRSIETAIFSDDEPSAAAEPLAGFVQLLAQAFAGRVEVPGEMPPWALAIASRTREPLVDDRFPLIGHLGDERADLALVVGIGALERGNFGLDPGFEFGGARQRPFDAVAHRGEFAADRLRQGRDVLAGDRLRLDQAHRDFARSPAPTGAIRACGGRARRMRRVKKIGPSAASRSKGVSGRTRLAATRRGATAGQSAQIAVERADRRPDERSR